MQSPNALSQSSRSGSYSYSFCCVSATSTVYLHQRIWNKVHVVPVQHKHLQSIVLSSHNQPVEHSTRQFVPTVTWQSSSRLVWASSTSCSYLWPCFYHTAQALVLSGSCYYCTVQLSRHATVLCLQCDIAQYWVGSFSGRQKRNVILELLFGARFIKNILGRT